MDVFPGTDFFTVEALTLRGLATYYVLFFIHIGSAAHCKGNVLLFPLSQARTTCLNQSVYYRERLGVLLKAYYQQAA